MDWISACIKGLGLPYQQISVDGKALRIVKDYYISSIKNLSAKQAYQLARGHWALENKLHWQLDVILREDEKRN